MSLQTFIVNLKFPSYYLHRNMLTNLFLCIFYDKSEDVLRSRGHEGFHHRLQNGVYDCGEIFFNLFLFFHSIFNIIKSKKANTNINRNTSFDCPFWRIADHSENFLSSFSPGAIYFAKGVLKFLDSFQQFFHISFFVLFTGRFSSCPWVVKWYLVEQT